MNDTWKYFLEENAEQLNEVNQQILNKVLARVNTKLAFNDVFGNAKRILLPNKLGGQLEKIDTIIYDKFFSPSEPYGIVFDLRNKKVSLTISTNNGEKQRDISVIKYFQDFLKIIEAFIVAIPKETDYNKFADLFQKYRIPVPFYRRINPQVVYDVEETKRIYIEKLEHYKQIISYIISELQKIYNLPPKLQNDGRLRVIVSRSPIDVLRMSDFKGIQSCHSPGGSYFQCAVTEAINEGLVAYLVDERELSSVDFEADEIFSDRDRGEPGIAPIARLRLRSYTVDNGNIFKIFIPSERVYSSHQPEFKKVVNEWAVQVQAKKIEFLKNNNTPDITISQQASYVDSGDSSSELFEKLLGETPQFNFDIDEDSDAIGRFDEEEISRINRRANQTLTYFDFGVDIGDDGDGHEYLNANAGLHIPLEKIQQFGDFFQTVSQKSWQEKREIKNILSATLLGRDHSVEDFECYNDFLKIYIDLSDSPNDESEAEDMLRSFIALESNLFSSGGSIEELYDSLVLAGHIEEEPVEQEHELNVENFKITSDESEIILYTMVQRHNKNIDFKSLYTPYVKEKMEHYFEEQQQNFISNKVISKIMEILEELQHFIQLKNLDKNSANRYVSNIRKFYEKNVNCDIEITRVSNNFIEFSCMIKFKKNESLLKNKELFVELINFMDKYFSDFHDIFNSVCKYSVSEFFQISEYEKTNQIRESHLKNKKIILTLRGK